MTDEELMEKEKSRQDTIKELDAYMKAEVQKQNKPSCKQCSHHIVCDDKRRNNHTVSQSVCKHFKSEVVQLSPEETKEKLSELLALCVIEQTVCNSDGEPVTKFTINLFEEHEMYDLVAEYLVGNGVGFVRKKDE